MTGVSDDYELIDRILAGSESACAELIRRHQTTVARIIHRITRRPDLVEDLTQEVFIRVLRGLDRFQRRSGFSTWLYRVTVNVGLDALRSEGTRRRAEAAVAVAEDAVPDGAVIGDYSSRALAFDRAEGLAIRQALARLSPRSRTILVLRHLEGFTTPELAAILGLPEGTVRSRLYYARLELAELLDPLAQSSRESQKKRIKKWTPKTSIG